MRQWLIAIATSSLLVSLIAARSQAPPPEAGIASGGALSDIVFVAAPRPSTISTIPSFPAGSSLMRLSPSIGSAPLNLTPGLFAVTDPQVSFDGRRLLFAAQKTNESLWQVWEMNSDGSGKHQITNCRGNCFRPAYLPTGDIVYTTATEQDGRWTSNLAVSAIDGSQARSITFGPGDYRLETVLHDGRVLASASSPLESDANHPSSRSLYTLRPDGSGLALLGADVVHDAAAADAEELDDGSSVLFIKRESGGDQFGGQLALLQQGRTGATPVDGVPALCKSPKRVSDKHFIMACATSAGSNSVPKFDLYLSSAATPAPAKLYGDQLQSSLQAVPLASRPRARILWSTLKDGSKAGYFVALNSYRSADFSSGRLPAKIERVRVLSLQSNGRQEKSLGEAPVEPDGSFYIAVPADQPVRFELLDHGGNILKAQKSWIWSRGGEQRACIGCHEDKALAPENHWPLALKKFDSPIQLGVKDVAPVAPE